MNLVGQCSFRCVLLSVSQGYMAGSTIFKSEGAENLRKNSTISNPRDAGVRDLKFGTNPPLDHI